MDFQELMLTYGYPILFLGVLVESEAFLLVGVYLAHRGYFSLAAVIGVAAFSTFVVTQLCFFLGHRYGCAFLVRRPRWQQRYNRVKQLMDRHGTGLVLGFRALYGLRGAIPAAVGLGCYPPLRFAVLNAVGALTWAVIVALAGTSLTQVIEDAFVYLRQHVPTVLIVAGIVGGIWCLYQLLRQARLKQVITPSANNE